MSFFSDLLTHVESFFSKIQAFLAPFEKQFATAVGPAVLAAAEQAVATFATQQLSGAQKQSGAHQAIVDNLKQQGLTAGESVVNSAIEAALAAYKAKNPTE